MDVDFTMEVFQLRLRDPPSWKESSSLRCDRFSIVDPLSRKDRSVSRVECRATGADDSDIRTTEQVNCSRFVEQVCPSIIQIPVVLRYISTNPLIATEENYEAFPPIPLAVHVRRRIHGVENSCLLVLQARSTPPPCVRLATGLRRPNKGGRCVCSSVYRRSAPPSVSGTTEYASNGQSRCLEFLPVYSYSSSE